MPRVGQDGGEDEVVDGLRGGVVGLGEGELVEVAVDDDHDEAEIEVVEGEGLSEC